MYAHATFLRAIQLTTCQTTAHDAFRALINLSDCPLMLGPLSEPSFLNFLVSYILVGLCHATSPLVSNADIERSSHISRFGFNDPVEYYDVCSDMLNPSIDESRDPTGP